MTRLDEFVRIKKIVDTKRQTLDKATGASEEVMKQIKKEFGCVTIKEAKKKRGQLKNQQQALEEKFDDAIVAFEETWSNELER